jgi:hypothetical protein
MNETTLRTGTVIAVAPEVAKLADGFHGHIQSCSEGMVIMSEAARHAKRNLWSVLRSAHPELNGWEIKYGDGELTLLFPVQADK